MRLCRQGIAIRFLGIILLQGCRFELPDRAGLTIKYTLQFNPVVFTFHSDGKISISGDRSIVTPVGRFTVEGDYELQSSQDSIKLTIRDYRRSTDEVFLVKYSQEVVAVLDGNTVLAVSNKSVLVDISS